MAFGTASIRIRNTGLSISTCGIASQQATFKMPFGTGHRLSAHNAVVDHIIGDWNWSGIATLSSGTWFTVTDGNADFANSDGQQRPDFVPGVKATSKPCIPGTFFNTCAFQNPPLGSTGDVSMNSLEGPDERMSTLPC
jgi:hypothetical protein